MAQGRVQVNLLLFERMTDIEEGEKSLGNKSNISLYHTLLACTAKMDIGHSRILIVHQS
jgi:hypothetical protein